MHICRAAFVLLVALVKVATAEPQGDIVFRSEVSLVRVDVQVVDRDNRAITGLTAEDFLLLEEGKPQQIRNFTREEMPVDVLLLLDVSGSMRPHVERIASAAQQALEVLGSSDRVAIMVFDRETRLRLPFRDNRGDVERAFEALLRQETFDGGTDVTRGLLDAVSYMARAGRREARRAIIVLTDDQTERDRDEARVNRALVSSDTVLSALLAPDAMGTLRGGGGGSSWPGGSMGGIIFGRRGPFGRRMPRPVNRGSRTQSAGTAEIARRSGGDSLRVDEASALETTLSRIRQRYALHYYLPEGANPGEQRAIEVELAQAARRRFPDADVRFRQLHQSGGGTHMETSVRSPEPAVASEAPVFKRRPAVNERAGTSSPASLGDEGRPGWRKVGEPATGGWRRVGAAPEPPAASAPVEDEPKPRPGWRRIKPGEVP